MVSIPYRLATNCDFLCPFHPPFWVSIPYRLATNSLKRKTKRKSSTVSIPYRLATNFWAVRLSLLSFWVSIPYRLATNEKNNYHRIGYCFEFQFLIGWLQTACWSGLSSVFSLFQFLIGWLQTSYSCSYAIAFTKFQFLIGWLQTKRWRRRDDRDCLVSIPYRLATNPPFEIVGRIVYLCFNSL